MISSNSGGLNLCRGDNEASEKPKATLLLSFNPKFNMCGHAMSYVLKSLFNIRALQRTNSGGHTTSQSVFIAGKARKTCFVKKPSRNFEICPSSAVDFDNFSLSSLTSEASKNFSRGRTHMS